MIVARLCAPLSATRAAIITNSTPHGVSVNPDVLPIVKITNKTINQRVPR